MFMTKHVLTQSEMIVLLRLNQLLPLDGSMKSDLKRKIIPAVRRPATCCII